jgi:hypothetical protein
VTTIVYRDGTMAADTGMTVGGSQVAHTTKISRNLAGDLAGGCGDAAWTNEFRKWFSAGEVGSFPPICRDKDDRDSGKGLIVRSDGAIIIFESGGSFPLRAPFYALGSGRCDSSPTARCCASSWRRRRR